MNSHYTTSPHPTLRISLFPKSDIYHVSRRHPLFWWHDRHIRSVLIEPVVSNGIFVAKYTDTRTGTIFIDRLAAEHYLGQVIIEPEYVNQLYVEKDRDVFSYCICKKCGGISGGKTEAVFQGHFGKITNSVTTLFDLPCPKCSEPTPTQISTEPSSIPLHAEDCDWIERPFSNDVKKK